MASLDPRRPFTRAEALSAGITPWQLRSSRCQRVITNVYVAWGVPLDVPLRARAALRLGAGRSSPWTSGPAVARGPGRSGAASGGGSGARGVDSPMETRLRMLLVLAGLPEPVVNHVIWNDRGDWYRASTWPTRAVRVAIEYDGRHHVEREGQWHPDTERRDDLDHRGWRLVTVVSSGIYAQPGTDPRAGLRRADGPRTAGARREPGAAAVLRWPPPVTRAPFVAAHGRLEARYLAREPRVCGRAPKQTQSVASGPVAAPSRRLGRSPDPLVA
jgi:hypothetical protein